MKIAPMGWGKAAHGTHHITDRALPQIQDGAGRQDHRSLEIGTGKGYRGTGP
jgi:hypothetical protein